MADGRRQGADRLPQEGDHLVEGRRYVARFRRRPSPVDQHMSLDVLGDEARTGAYAFHLALDAPVKAGLRADAEQLKFDTRTAGVEDKDCFSHWLRLEWA